MFGAQPLRLWCMAAMAPALTEAATQARAKLPTVGHSTGVTGRPVRRDCPSPSLDTGDALDSVRSQPVSQTPTASVAGKTPSHLLTLPKQPDSTSSKAFIGIRRLAVPGLKASDSGVRIVGTVGKPEAADLSSSSVKGDVTQLTISGSQTSRPHDLLLIQTLDRMNQPKITLPQSTSSTTSVTQAGSVRMPHSAAAPNLQVKSSSMGYTFKSSPQTSTQTHGESMAESQSGGVAGGAGGDVGEGPTTPTTPIETDGLSLQAVDDIASVTHVDIQSGPSTGIADVGLLNNVDRVAETAKRQRELERQADRILRRLRRIQTRQTVSHVKQQLSGFVDHQHKNLQTMAKAMKPQPTNSVDLKAELLQNEDVKSLSTAALVSLVRRLQTSQAMTLRQRLANANQSGSEGTSVLRLDQDLCTEMNRVSSTVQKDLKHLESALDSDATESSSGGESCDEDYDYDEEKGPKTCLRRRAEWKWAADRAAVASKWTWLQAQVSDLEYRIRQQSDIYRQIRAAKGAVVLGEPAPPEDFTKFRSARAGRRLSPLEEKIANLERKNEMSPCNLSTLLCNVDKQSMRLTQQLGNVLSPAQSPLLASKPQATPSTPPKTPNTPNGLLSSAAGAHAGATASTPSATASTSAAPTDGETGKPTASTSSSSSAAADGPLSLSFDPPSPAVDATCQAARCRPVRSYGKRKLLTTSGLYQLSRKAARLSTVPCNCYPPTVPCAMCGGRYNNTQSVQPSVMPTGERIALLDASYHQVLSFPQDTPLPIHFESLLRCGEWQHKPLPTKPLRPLGSGKGKQKIPVSERKYKKLSKSATAAVLSSAKIRNKYEMKPHSRNHGSLPSSSDTNYYEMTLSSKESSSQRAESKFKKRKCSLSSIGMHDGARKRRTLSASAAAAAVAAVSAAAVQAVGGSPSVTTSPTSASPRDTPSPLSHSCPSSTLRELKEAQQQRRRRGESAFDINNIVIPYSMAASTRVEKLLYKEIITPKWREIGSADDKQEGEPDAASVLPTPTTTPEQETPMTDPEPTNTPLAPVPTPLQASATGRTLSPSVLPTGGSLGGTAAAGTSNEEESEPLPAATAPKVEDTVAAPPGPTHPADGGSGDRTSPAGPPLDSTQSLQEPSSESTDTPATTTVTRPVNSSVTTTTTTATTSKPTPHENGEVKETPEEETSLEVNKLLPKPGGNGLVLSRIQEPEDEDEEIEDLSEELFAVRHLRCEIKEKKRFTSVVKKRTRGGRTDSMGLSTDEAPTATTSSGATPEPLEQVPPPPPPASATSTPPGTPAMTPRPQLTALLDEEMELCSGRRRSGSCSSHEDAALVAGGRRRSLSGRLRSRVLYLSSSTTSSLAADEQEEVGGIDPWPCRTFPLDDADYERLFQDTSSDLMLAGGGSAGGGSADALLTSRGPRGHAATTTTRGGYTYHTATPENSNPTSPIPSSSNSSVMDDDPNDPEWTVVDGTEKPAQQPSLLLKLAKR